MALIDMIKNIREPSEKGLLKDLDLWLLTGYKDLDNVDRGHSGNLHPSGISGCPRAVIYERIGVPSVEVWPMSAKTQRIFGNGNSFHKRMQEYYSRMGILWGGWKCHSCEGCSPIKNEVSINNTRIGKGCKVRDSLQPACPRGFSKDWVSNQEIKPKFEYTEPGFYIESCKISGYTDGIAVRNNEKIALEFKSIKEQNFSALVGPQPDHIEQIHLYMVGFSADYGIIQYECKNDQSIKEYVVEKNEEINQRLFDRANMIWNCLSTQQIPTRKCKNIGEARWCSYKEHCFNDFQNNEQYWDSYSRRI